MSRQRLLEPTCLAVPEADDPVLVTADAGLAVRRNSHTICIFAEGFAEWANFVILSIPNANTVVSGDEQLASIGNKRD